MKPEKSYPFNNPFKSPLDETKIALCIPRRYALLAGYCGSSAQGWDSFCGFFNSLEDAVEASLPWISPAKWFQIVNLETGSIVRESEEVQQ